MGGFNPFFLMINMDKISNNEVSLCTPNPCEPNPEASDCSVLYVPELFSALGSV